MKELTYEEWVKNPTPREMWVWNDKDGSDKVERKVVHILNVEPCYFPVMTVNENNSHYNNYRYCAEIEKQRRMTNQELAWWLRENPTREYKYNSMEESSIRYEYIYAEKEANELVDDGILIREDGGEWREPLAEVEE